MKTRKALPENLDPGQLEQAAVKRAEEEAGTWRRYACRLVTPMFGGGVRAGEVDRDLPIRSTAIRGQLRFWWRLLNRHRQDLATAEGKPDSKRLFQAERDIWGGLGDADGLAASRVRVVVKSATRVGNALAPKDGSPLGRMIVTNAGAAANWLPVARRFEFTLELSMSDWEESVVQALRMWATFGGVGARRRRGLGAIEVADAEGVRVVANKADLEAAKCELRAMPDMEFDTYRKAAEAGIQRLIDFRQKPELARGPERDRRPGGSYWPEANAVRRLTGRARDKNKHALSADTPLLFPRALLGLPIVFQFRLHEREGDPFGSTLEIDDMDGITGDRFASPLIFGARPESRGNGTIYRPVVLLLPTHNDLRKRGLKLKTKGGTKRIASGSWWPNDPEVRRRVLPGKLKPLAGGNADVLTAFLNFFAPQKKSK